MVVSVDVMVVMVDPQPRCAQLRFCACVNVSALPMRIISGQRSKSACDPATLRVTSLTPWHQRTGEASE